MDNDFDKPFNRLCEWYDTPLGSVVGLTIEQRLSPILKRLLGYYLVNIGVTPPCDWLASSRVRQRVLYQHIPNVASVCGEYLSLPFAANSIDVVVLPHLLEWHTEPEEILSEVDRILLPEGHVIIIGFNPYSLWRLVYWGRLGSSLLPWRGCQLISLWQIKNWLSLYNFSLVSLENFFYRPPINNTFLLNKLMFLETLAQITIPFPGAVYLVVAQKKIAKMRLIKSIETLPKYAVNSNLSKI